MNQMFYAILAIILADIFLTFSADIPFPNNSLYLIKHQCDYPNPEELEIRKKINLWVE